MSNEEKNYLANGESADIEKETTPENNKKECPLRKLPKKQMILALVAGVLLVAIILTLVFTLGGCLDPAPKITSDTLFVKKVENMPENFIMGMDASAVPSLEASGVKYYDYDGTERTFMRSSAKTVSIT